LLENKRVLITGANGGIGSSIAKILLKNHAKLVLFYHNDKTQIDKLLEENVNQKDNIETHNLDLLKTKEIEKTVSKIIKRKIDIFIHAATLPITHKKIENMDWDEYQKHIDLQTKAFFEITKKPPLMYTSVFLLLLSKNFTLFLFNFKTPNLCLGLTAVIVTSDLLL